MVFWFTRNSDVIYSVNMDQLIGESYFKRPMLLTIFWPLGHPAATHAPLPNNASSIDGYGLAQTCKDRLQTKQLQSI